MGLVPGGKKPTEMNRNQKLRPQALKTNQKMGPLALKTNPGTKGRNYEFAYTIHFRRK